MTIILIGMKNSGKTTVGQALAQHLDIPFLDTDRLIEDYYNNKHHQHCAVHDIYLDHGEEYFRKCEQRVITALKPAQDSVIATGGGSILKQQNLEHLEQLGQLVYLYIDSKQLLNRIQLGPLPAYVDPTAVNISICEHFNDREDLYRTWADTIIDTRDKSIDKIVTEICDEVLCYGE